MSLFLCRQNTGNVHPPKNQPGRVVWLYAITPMKHHLLIPLLVGLIALPCAEAQQMPQNYWRYEGTQFANPGGQTMGSIAIGSGGVFVAEIHGGVPTRLLKFTEAGAFVTTFATVFTNIHGVACDSTGNVYVLDGTAPFVKKFDADGNALTQWGAQGAADGQLDIAASNGTQMIATDSAGLIYVCDPGNSRIQVFDGSGTFQRKWGNAGGLPGQFAAGKPTEICVSPDNHVFASVGKVFDTLGNYVTTFYNVPSPGNVFAVAPDGMFLTNQWGWYITHLSKMAGTNFDGAQVSPTENSAFSKRGDLFSVIGTQISVFKREYRDAPNFPVAPGIPQPAVLSAAQRPGTSLMDITYKVTDIDSPTVTTGLLAFKDGGLRLDNVVVPQTFAEGTASNLGALQPRDTPLTVTWDMAADALADTNLQMEVLAKDSRDLLGIHWINVPASGGDPAFQACAAPITDSQLFDLWLWFLATRNDVHMSTSADGNYRTIVGTTGVYTGQTLAFSSNWDIPITSTKGRAYAYDRMGVRPISGAELVRAQAGSYGFSALGNLTVVKAAGSATDYYQGWGSNGYSESNWFTFYAPSAVDLACGSEFTLFLMSDGSLWGVGRNEQGQLGDGTTTNRTIPIKIATNVTKIATGNYHSVFVKSDGTLWAMGNNDYGQLGDGTTAPRFTPVQVPGATNVIAVGAGAYFSMFVQNDGSLWGMGENGDGQLGDGTNTQRHSPVQVPSISGVTKVTGGRSHALFLKNDGTLWGMGHNGNGELGDGTSNGRNTPAAVSGGTNVTDISTGSYHSMFVKSDGTLWGVGYNGYGQLGDGTTTQRYLPVQTSGAANVTRVAAGNVHTAFLCGDSSCWSMGDNSAGQLGDNTNIMRLIPVQVDSHVTAISANANHTGALATP